MDELEFYNGQLTGEEIDKRIIYLSTAVSSLPHTVSNANITAKHVVLNARLSTPQNKKGEWKIATSAGSLTITGALYGATNLYLVLGIPL